MSTLFPRLPYDMGPRSREAAADPQLREFLRRATLVKNEGRKAALQSAFGGRVDRLRELAGRIRRHTLEHLDHYLERFVESAERAGARVHFAGTAEEANAIAAGIAGEIGARLCVKSKSMVTEETRLLPALEAVGCETVETDLGEFILQLDGDTPSHIVTPMIHKDRAAVARALQRELGADYTEDPAELTRIARRHLREKYRRADLGISGANFLVAETGTVVGCTNEGNGRFCTSAPRTHIVFAGIEKLVPREEHLAVMLKLLARSSTGQPLTCYTHLVTGPRRPDEADGPEQVHVILVDNGRTGILGDELREVLACIRCGACLNSCPVYRVVGGHSYGSVYSGPIGAILTPQLSGPRNYPDPPQASSLCGACSEACPVAIDIPRHLIRLRGRLDSPRERFVMRLWARVVSRGLTYRMAAWAQRVLLRLRARLAGTLERGDAYGARGWIGRAHGPLARWTVERDLPTPPARSFRHWWKRRSHREG